MITEDYVSFEIAKLLKEKGFDESCFGFYTPEKELHFTLLEETNSTWLDDSISAPTLQMAMKWLREVHKLHCDVGYDDLDWFWNILDVSKSVPVEERPRMVKNGSAGFKKYEEVCEAATRYCLENLI